MRHVQFFASVQGVFNIDATHIYIGFTFKLDNKMNNMKTLVTTFIYAAILAGCGGGSSSSVSTAPASILGMTTVSTPVTSQVVSGAEGLWNGATSTGIKITGLVLADGTFWFMYNSPSDNDVIAGAVQGNGRLNNGTFTSSNALDFNLDGMELDAATVSATFMTQQTINGAISYPDFNNQKVSFSASYNSNYEQTPSLATIVGTYAGTASEIDGPDMGTLTINAGGCFSFAGASACNVTGTVLPRAKGNVYNLSVTFGGAPCANPNTSTTGVGFFDPASKRFYALGLNTSRTTGFNFMGIKQ